MIKIPAGEAPEHIRQAWVGLELPCDPILGCPDQPEHGAVSGEKADRNRYGFSVPQFEALEILEKHNPEAAKYWRDQGFPKSPPYDYFGFDEGEAEIISGITRQNLIHVPDETQGDPYR